MDIPMNIIRAASDPIAVFLGEWSVGLNAASAALRIALSIALATIIGCERSSKRHSAGLRTFILLSLAATVGSILDVYMSTVYGASFSLISAAIVVGAATICVNSMMFSSKNQIKGLTTAVGLWACGLIGLAAGAGLYTVTLISFAVLLCCLSLFPKFEIYLKNRSNHFEIHLELNSGSKLREFITTIRTLGLAVDEIESNPAYISSGLSVYSIALSIESKELKKYKTHSEIIKALASIDYVYYVEEMR